MVEKIMSKVRFSSRFCQDKALGILLATISRHVLDNFFHSLPVGAAQLAATFANAIPEDRNHCVASALRDPTHSKKGAEPPQMVVRVFHKLLIP